MSATTLPEQKRIHLIFWGERFFGSEKEYIGHILLKGLFKQMKNNPMMQDYGNIISSPKVGGDIINWWISCSHSPTNPLISIHSCYTSSIHHISPKKSPELRYGALNRMNGIFFLFNTQKDQENANYVLFKEIADYLDKFSIVSLPLVVIVYNMCGKEDYSKSAIQKMFQEWNENFKGNREDIFMCIDTFLVNSSEDPTLFQAFSTLYSHCNPKI